MPNATKNLLLNALAGIAIAVPAAANASCWEAASRSYGIPVDVLKAVAKTESGLNPKARNKNTNGTYDIGLMQINSAWLPKLESYGITERSLHDSCMNLKVGAWILSRNAQKLGWNWNAIGAYNVGCARLDAGECERRRNRYAWKIHAALQKIGKLPSYPDPRLSYEQSATDVSGQVIRGSGLPLHAEKKIMVVKVGRTEQALQVAVADPDLAGSSGTVGGFLNYEGVSDE